MRSETKLTWSLLGWYSTVRLTDIRLTVLQKNFRTKLPRRRWMTCVSITGSWRRTNLTTRITWRCSRLIKEDSRMADRPRQVSALYSWTSLGPQCFARVRQHRTFLLGMWLSECFPPPTIQECAAQIKFSDSHVKHSGKRRYTPAFFFCLPFHQSSGLSKCRVKKCASSHFN